MKTNKLSSFLVSQDIFGSPIGVHYRGDGSYQTRLGAFCTIVTYVLIVINTTALIQAFLDNSKQEEK